MNLQNSPKMCSLFEQKKEKIIHLLEATDPQNIYEKIIELGRDLPKCEEFIQIPSYLVEGCQSQVYLKTQIDGERKTTFSVYSEALISSGLAALLLMLYHKEPIQLILFHPPTFFTNLGILSSLSPGRSNGFASMYLKMKADSIKQLVELAK